MTYSSGGLIQVTDYNTRVGTVNGLWSTGTGTSGYGQTALTTNNAGDIVTASQWATMISKMQAMQQHQSNNTTGVPTQPGAGSIITYLSTFDTCTTTLTTNKLNTAGAGTSTTITATNSTTWTGRATRTFVLTFSSNDAARYFFNAGGYVQINFTGTSMSANSKSTYWNTFLTTGIGTHTFRATSSSYSGTGFTPTTNLTGSGYYNLTTGATTFFKVFDSPSAADYTNNYVQIDYTGSTAGANGDKGAVITANVTCWDGAVDTGPNDQVIGTLTCNFVVVPPWSTTQGAGYLANTWAITSTTNTVNTQGAY